MQGPEVESSAARRGPTILDVARETGLSGAAVSYALNGGRGVAAQTRQRVLHAADALGFRPNRLALALRTGHSRVLGLLLADISNPFYPEIAASVIAAAAAANYQVFLSHTGLDGDLQQREVDALLDHKCSGLIFTTVVGTDEP
ncbi:MAG: LacI family DNA-binding transcriptional regulator, partial [Chloroflexota bacterium]